jgi:S1-C subfamily serine protease
MPSFMRIFYVLATLHIFSHGFRSSKHLPRTMTTFASLLEYENELIALFENARPSVVFISTLNTVFNPWRMNVMEIPSQSGSGYVWDLDGIIVTNYHVLGQPATGLVDTYAEYMVSFVNKDGSREGIKAKVCGVDADKDVAVLKLNTLPTTQKLKCIDVGVSECLRVGQLTLAIGNPFGLDQTLTTGVVSGLGRQVMAPNKKTIFNMIQTDAAINPGNSGGPLLDSQGKLIGMNTAIYSTSGQSSGVGFAVPVDTIKVIVELILKNGKYDKPETGLVFIGGNEAKALFGVKRGLVVTQVLPNSAAEAAGFRPSTRTFPNVINLADVIVESNGRKVDTEADFLSSIDLKLPGDIIDMKVLRYRERNRGPAEVAMKLKLYRPSQTNIPNRSK